VANVTCPGLSLYVDPALASGGSCEIVPESTDELEPHPQHTLVTFEGYPLADTYFPAQIAVYPVADYTVLMNTLRPDYPDYIPGLVTDLQALTSGGADPVFVESFDPPLPFLPTFGAAQVFFAQYAAIPFEDGGGIRFLTEYAHGYKTINNIELFYTYQALTEDGQYWISAILPINHATLPANTDDLPGGVTFDDFIANYEPYITGAVGDLNAAAPGSFTPSIDDLDSLVASIAITP
jgi:hypothetical protein